MIHRRQFTGGLAAAGLTSALASVLAPASARGATSVSSKKKIAFLGTDIFEHSHSQHFLDRFHLGCASGGRWRESQVEVAGVYVDQFNERDIGRQRIAKYGLQQFDTIAETLTLGGPSLAVDGVVIIGEHGKYPKNDKGQTLYPRYQWFKEIVSVFEQSGRSVPVFNDKHLSTDWNECLEMVADSRRLEFPFYAGSSLPVTWRLPQLELPLGVPLRESVCVAYGGVDSYDFHALETSQCMSERRRGGEVGVRQVTALTGDRVWELLSQREVTRQLFVSALSRSHSLPVETGYPTDRVTFDWAKQALSSITGYFIEHLDGFHTAIFLTNIQDFNYAGMQADTGELVGCQMMLPMPGRNATTADFFNPLSIHVEQMVVTGKTIYPIDRTLLTSGMVIAAVDSLHAGGTAQMRDDMQIAYRPAEGSMFWQE